MDSNLSQPDCRVLVLHNDVDLYLSNLTKRFPTVQFKACRTVDELQALDPQFSPHVIFCWKSPTMPPQFQRDMLRQSKAAWVQIGGAGFDHLLPLDDLTMPVTNMAGVLSHFLVEVVVGAVLMLNFGFPRYIQQQREQVWQKNRWHSVSEKTALIIGLGNIGTKVAQTLQGLGMHVLGMRQSLKPTPGVDELIPLNRLADALPRADFVSLHLPLTSQTRHLIGRDELALMRPDAFLINTARGGVVDETALIEALQQRQIAGAYLDVFEQEPLPPDSALWGLENVVLSPHYADAVVGWETHFAQFFGDNLERWLAGKPLLNVVDVKRGY